MSTKCTRKYANTKVFGLHLYDDFMGGPAIDIRVNGASTTLPLTKEEADIIDRQLNGEDIEEDEQNE